MLEGKQPITDCSQTCVVIILFHSHLRFQSRRRVADRLFELRMEIPSRQKDRLGEAFY